MPATKVSVGRMTTSRDGPTKYEHFVTIHNDRDETIQMTMHYQPERAVYEATDLAAFLGVPLQPLVIEGVTVELDDLHKSMLRYAPEVAEEGCAALKAIRGRDRHDVQPLPPRP